jgi:FkbM family methyltransferase
VQVNPSALTALFTADAEGRLPGQVGISFSQFAEDLVLWHYLSDRWNGFYVDVGAHDPYRFSNTYLLHRFRHWHGINIDLDDGAVRSLAQARPGDTNIQAAVGGKRDQRLKVTRFEEGALNTANSRMADQFSKTYPIRDKIDMQAQTLADILGEHAPDRRIDLLSVDVEGLEHEVLLGNDWSAWRPDYVLIERHDVDLPHVSDDDVFRLLASEGYRLLSHVVVTSLYVRATD